MGVFLGRGAGFVHLVITLVLRQWKTARAASRVRDEIALGWAVAQPTYREVCLQSHLPRINTLSQWGLRRHRGDTYTCSENLEKITTCVFSKEFPSGLCTHLVGG